MLSANRLASRPLIRDPLEHAGRGFPVEGHDRTATQKLMISQANAVLGNHECLLKNISTHANKDPQGPIQALVECTTRLSQAIRPPAGMIEATQTDRVDLEQLKMAAESGVRFIEAHVHEKLAPGHPAKAQLASHADALLRSISDLSSQPPRDDTASGSFGSDFSVASDVCSDAPEDTLDARMSPPRASQSSAHAHRTVLIEAPKPFRQMAAVGSDSSVSTTNSASSDSEVLFEQLRAFVRTAKPHFSEPGDTLVAALGKRTTDLHSVLFKHATPGTITMRKIAARSAVIFAANDFVSKPQVTPQQRRRVLDNAHQMVASIDALLTQPALRLGVKSRREGRAQTGWLRGLLA